MTDKIAFINATVLDGTENMQPQPGMTVLTEAGIITAVTAVTAAPQTLDGYKVIDLAGKHLMPGLINLHCHLPSGGKPRKVKKGDKGKLQKQLNNPIAKMMFRKMSYKYAMEELMSGVTTVRAVGGLGNADSEVRDMINSGKKPGPRILSAGMAITAPRGHMAGVFAKVATTPVEAVALVDEVAAGKPDLIKLMVTGGVIDGDEKGEPGKLRMLPEMIKAACDRAHELGYCVAAHVQSRDGLREAVKNGVDTIEHGAIIEPDVREMFIERGAKLITTLSPSIPTQFMPREYYRPTDTHVHNGRIVLEGMIAGAREALAAGIPVGLGTDPGTAYVTQYDMWRELMYFHKLVGVSNAFALHTATLRNAQIAGIAHETGSITPGKSADFVITVDNPLDDLRALQKVSMVVMRGRVFDSPKVEREAEYDEMLDKTLANIDGVINEASEMIETLMQPNEAQK